jgi:hypothetical protein
VGTAGTTTKKRTRTLNRKISLVGTAGITSLTNVGPGKIQVFRFFIKDLIIQKKTALLPSYHSHYQFDFSIYTNICF